MHAQQCSGAKGHTKWLFPSLDVDEYLNLRVVPDASQQSQNIASFLDEQVEKYMPGQKAGSKKGRNK